MSLDLLNDLIKGEAPKATAQAPVADVSEIDRILALPRRAPPSMEEQTEMARAMTARLRYDPPGGKCACALLRPEVVARGQNPCITELRPIQGWYLTEAANNVGVLGAIAVGGGKTGIDILTPMVVEGCDLAVLLIPSNLKGQLLNDYRIWRQHFKVPNLRGGPGGPYVTGRPKLEIFPYSHLSQPKNSVWLKARAKETPNLILLGDEVQAVKDVNSVRTYRFLNLFDEFPSTRLFCHSGSLISRSVLDATHLAALSLRDGSPAPIDKSVAEDWALALDPLVGNAASAAPSLKRLCAEGETSRKAFHRRFVETRGVVATEDAGLSTKLEFRVRTPPKIPFAVEEALEDARLGKRPDGEELDDAYEISACCKQVSAGFYLYWAFPRGEPEELILDWFAKRKAWGKELRQRLERRGEFMDSPALLVEAAERYHLGTDAGDAPTWRSVHWPAWAEIAGKVKPVTKVKWISDWLMKDAVEWGKQSPGIIWCLNDEPRQRIAQLGGFVQYGEGKKAEIEIQRERGDRTIVASIRAHGTGRNLQFAYNRNLFVQLPSDGYEQYIGRTHRPGQPSDVVTVDWYQHTPEYVGSLEKGVEYAKFVRDTTGSAQKLLYGEWK